MTLYKILNRLTTLTWANVCQDPKWQNQNNPNHRPITCSLCPNRVLTTWSPIDYNESTQMLPYSHNWPNYSTPQAIVKEG